MYINEPTIIKTAIQAAVPQSLNSCALLYILMAREGGYFGPEVWLIA